MPQKLFAILVSLSFIGLPLNISLAQEKAVPTSEKAPAKTGLPQTNGQVGTSTSCFDFYKFGSVELDMTKNFEEYSPNDPVIINGTVKNKNNYPLINTTVLARVIKNHPKPTPTGAILTVAENIILENVTFAANESKNVSSSWILPNNATEGDYQILFYVFSNDRFNMAGLTFTDDIYASRLAFKVIGGKKEQVYLDQGNIKINNKTHQVIGFATSHEKDKPVNFSLPLVNATGKDQTIEVKYSLYSWDTLLQKNLLRVNKESIQLKSNSSKNIVYNIASATEPVYTLKITATSSDSQTSISNIRFTVRDTARARFNFIGIDKFPISSGDKVNLYSCIHNTNFGTTADGTTMRVLMKDDKGATVSSVYYEGNIPSDINALKSEFTAKKRYNKVTLEAQLFDKDKNVIDSLSIPYDCKDINGGNQCLNVLNDNKILDPNKSAALLGFSSLAVLLGVGGFYLHKKEILKNNMNNINVYGKTIMNKISKFLLISGLVLIGLGGTPSTQARNVTFPLYAQIGYNQIPDGLEDYFSLSGTFRHDFDFKMPSNMLASNNINLTINDTLKGINTPTYGDWFLSGGFYDSPPMDGIIYNADPDQDYCVSGGRNCHFSLVPHFGFHVPKDSSVPKITSNNPNVVSCNGLDCRAVNLGNAQITIEFPNQNLSTSENFSDTFATLCLKDNRSDTVYGNLDNVYGYTEMVKKNYFSDLPVDCLKSGYRFNSLTYNVTVRATANNLPTTTYSGTNQITSNSAKASWTYSDPENDAQTNSQLQVASDASFTNIVFNGTPGAVTNGTITGLSGNTTYYPRVRVYNNINGWSQWASGSSFNTNNTPTVPLPDITFTANPTQVYRGDTFTLAWDVTNANLGCRADDEWSGPKALNGTEPRQVASNAIFGAHTYSLICTNSGGDSTKSVTVNVVPRPTPTVDVTLNNTNNPGTLDGGNPITINWNTTNPDSIGTCTAQGQWTGDKAKTGGTESQTLPNPLTQTAYNYELTCTKLDGGSITDVVNVTVNPSISVSCTTTPQVTDSSGKVEVKATVQSGSNPYTFTLDPDGGTSSSLTVTQPTNEKIWSVDYSTVSLVNRNPKVSVTTNGKTKSNVSCGSVTNYGKRLFREVSP